MQEMMFSKNCRMRVLPFKQTWQGGFCLIIPCAKGIFFSCVERTCRTK